MTQAHFNVMAPNSNPVTDSRYSIAATFYCESEKQLLEALNERLPGMRRDGALVAVNAEALELLLRLSLGGYRG